MRKSWQPPPPHGAMARVRARTGTTDCHHRRRARRMGLRRPMIKLLHRCAIINHAMRNMFEDNRAWCRNQGAHIRPPMLDDPSKRARVDTDNVEEDRAPQARGARDPASRKESVEQPAMRALFEARDVHRVLSLDNMTRTLNGEYVGTIQALGAMHCIIAEAPIRA